MLERKFKSVSALLMGILLILIAVLAYELAQLNRTPARSPLPNPNGYDDFVKAQKALTVDPNNFESTRPRELQDQLAKNADSLKLLRRGLTKQCRVPLEFSTNYLSIVGSLGHIKQLAYLLVADGRLAELEHRTNDAARCYLEAIRFGEESCRGGLMINKLFGVACEAIAVRPFERSINSLDINTCRVAIRQLREIDQRRDTIV